MTGDCKFRFAVCLSVLLPICQLAITRVQAQGTAATVQGTVTDMSGAVVADAAISVKNTETGITQNTTSDGQGRYRAPDLPVGDFEITATKPGFSTVVHSGITLTVGTQTVVDFSLPVGQAQQTVTVQGDVSQVETTSSAVSNLVEPEQMRELPLNGRNFAQLLTLSPGIIPNSAKGGLFGSTVAYAVGGAKPEGQAFLLDNSDIQDWWNHGSGSGALGTSLGIDGIGEFQTLTNTYTAQFGGNGAVINAVSKSGTNSFHGSAYEFLRNSDLDSRNFYDGLKVPAFRRNQFGGTVGGPIKKDKAFFFVNYEGLRSALGQTVVTFVPDANARNGFLPCNVASTLVCNTATNLANVGIAPSIASTIALYPLTSAVSATGVAQLPQIGNQAAHENYLLARFDYTFSDKDSLFGRYVRDTANQVSPFATDFATWPEVDTTANHFATLEERHIFSASLINLARVTFNRPNDAGSTTGSVAPLTYWPGSGFQNGEVTVSGMTPLGPSSLLPYFLIQNKFVESDDVIWTRGAHSFTFGASVKRQQDNGSGPISQAGVWAFTSLLNLMTAKATSLTGGIPGQYDATRSMRELPMAFYANDSWKATSRLTVSLGLRYEPGTNPTEAFNNFYQILNPPYGGFARVPAFFQSNPYMKDFDPRVGLAYDPFKDHKTSIRGGFGIFHDPFTAAVMGSCSFGLPPALQLTQSNPTYPTPFTAVSASIPSVSPGCNWTKNATPYMMQYNTNVQRDIGFGTILTVGYVGSRGVHLIDEFDANAPLSSGNAYGPYASIVGNSIVTNPRPNPAFSTMILVNPRGLSRYDSLQVTLRRRLTNNWQAQLSYTGSHSMDTLSTYFGTGGNITGGAQNPSEVNWDWATSSFSRANVVNANSVYMLPFNRNILVRGWQVSGIFTYTSGAPLNVTTGVNQAWSPVNTPERPNYTPGCNWQNGTVTQWYIPGCFTLPPVGIIGDLGRYALIGPGLVNQDFSIMKDTKIGERLDIQFRAEFFNIFNHPDFGQPTSTNFVSGATVGTGKINPSAGIITTTTNNSRQIQFGLKAIF